MLRNLIRRRFRRILWPVAGACLVAYFIFYLLQGDRGVGSLLHLKRQVNDARQTLDKKHVEEGRLESRVKLLRPDTLDLDMLDERARETLGYARSDDLVIPVSPSGSSPGEGGNIPSPLLNQAPARSED
ncbi:MAG TPA: hypothetical protein DCW68_01185 [Rhodospirillaceae bacterium]|nr:MAG: hypothetical protein A2018_04145 [Alphaproteobacteria bacterium GWF2_58_20]HAU28712.1 hypothetical protein [Rhodospirillaceae bacterium]